jgi:hypothetical protein
LEEANLWALVLNSKTLYFCRSTHLYVAPWKSNLQTYSLHRAWFLTSKYIRSHSKSKMPLSWMCKLCHVLAMAMLPYNFYTPHLL